MPSFSRRRFTNKDQWDFLSRQEEVLGTQRGVELSTLPGKIKEPGPLQVSSLSKPVLRLWVG